nr:MAG TPA: hypothetical protein [Caudoviricetes sp.]
MINAIPYPIPTSSRIISFASSYLATTSTELYSSSDFTLSYTSETAQAKSS